MNLLQLNIVIIIIIIIITSKDSRLHCTQPFLTSTKSQLGSTWFSKACTSTLPFVYIAHVNKPFYIYSKFLRFFSALSFNIYCTSTNKLHVNKRWFQALLLLFSPAHCICRPRFYVPKHPSDAPLFSACHWLSFKWIFTTQTVYVIKHAFQHTLISYTVCYYKVPSNWYCIASFRNFLNPTFLKFL